MTETDKASEAAVVGALSAAFPQHAILGEEGGVLGNVESDYLWWVILGSASFVSTMLMTEGSGVDGRRGKIGAGAMRWDVLGNVRSDYLWWITLSTYVL